jgi:hypothetical protein
MATESTEEHGNIKPFKNFFSGFSGFSGFRGYLAGVGSSQ